MPRPVACLAAPLTVPEILSSLTLGMVLAAGFLVHDIVLDFAGKETFPDR